MRTVIDGSCLLTPHPTGVTIAVRALLNEKRIPLDGDVEIVSYGVCPPTSAQTKSVSLPWNHKRVPSKFLHAVFGSRLTSFDQFFGKMDRLFLPNINIIGIPRVPYDLLIHDLSFLIHPWWFSLKMRAWHRLARPRKLIEGAERVFAVSEWTKQDLMRYLHIPEKRITVVDIPVPLVQKNSQPRPLAEPYFLLFSAHDERKNARCIEIAFLELVKTHPCTKLVLIGKGDVPSHPNILHRPYLNNTDRVTWLEHAAALLYPSWYEGMGLPPQEAAMLGVPVITSGMSATARTAPAGSIFLSAHRPEQWKNAMIDKL